MKTDREEFELHGPVRSVRTEVVTLFNSTTQEGIGNRAFYEELLFDTAGRLIEQASAENYIEQEPFRFVYTYDKEGRIIETKGYEEDDSPAGITTYSYDPEGNKLEEIYYHPARQGTHEIFYDHRGNIIESVYRQADGTITMRQTWTYKYKAEGNRVEEEYWHKEENNIQITDENGLAYTGYFPFGLSIEEAQAVASQVDPEKGTWHKRIITYDDSGRVVEKIEYESNGEVYSRKRYDAEGRIIEEVNNWGGEDKTTFEYDERGRLTNLTHTRPKDGLCPEAINRKYFYAYDEVGNLTEIDVNDGDGSLYERQSYRYEYDSWGNWTKKVETWITKSGHESVTEYARIIDYY